MRIRLYDDATGEGRRRGQEPGLDGARPARGVPLPVVARFALDRATRVAPATSNNAIFLFDTKSGKLQQATSGYLNDTAADLRSRR